MALIMPHAPPCRSRCRGASGIVRDRALRWELVPAKVSCPGLFGSDVFRGRLGLPLVCVYSRLNCDGCTSWHVRTAPDAWKDGGAVLRGILFLHRQIGEKKQAKRWRSAPKINLSKTDVRTGLVGLKVDGGGGRVSRCWGQQTQSGGSPKLRL